MSTLTRSLKPRSIVRAFMSGALLCLVMMAGAVLGVILYAILGYFLLLLY